MIISTHTKVLEKRKLGHTLEVLCWINCFLGLCTTNYSIRFLKVFIFILFGWSKDGIVSPHSHHLKHILFSIKILISISTFWSHFIRNIHFRMFSHQSSNLLLSVDFFRRKSRIQFVYVNLLWGVKYVLQTELDVIIHAKIKCLVSVINDNQYAHIALFIHTHAHTKHKNMKVIDR